MINTVRFQGQVREGDILTDMRGKYYYVLSVGSEKISAVSPEEKVEMISTVALDKRIGMVSVVKAKIIKDRLTDFVSLYSYNHYRICSRCLGVNDDG